MWPSPDPVGTLKRRARALLPLPLLRRAMPREVVGLLYHVVSDEPLPHVRHLFRYKSAAQFEADLVYLKRHFRPLSYAELLAGGAPGGVGKPGVVLTFDDGYAECFSVARPLLLKHGVPAVFFVATDFLDNRRLFHRNRVSLCLDRAEGIGLGVEDFGALRRHLRALGPADPALDRACEALGVDGEAYLRRRRPYLTTDEVRQLAAEGFTIGGHTRSHPALGELDAAEVEREVVESCRVVRELTGGGSIPFAFPFSGDGVSRGLLARLRAEHPFLGLFFDSRRLRRDREFILHRVPVDRPPGGGAPSSIPDHLRRAYLSQAVWNVQRALRPGGGRSSSE